jgi:hypothetical protein
MFFLPLNNLPPDIKKKYINNLVNLNKKMIENKNRQKEIDMYQKIINNPPKSLSITLYLSIGDKKSTILLTVLLSKI